MVYHQSIAWAVNYGMAAFLDSTITHRVYQLLGEAERRGAGRKLLTSGLALNPYNFLLTDAAQAAAATAQEQVQFWRTFQATLQAAGDKAGCPPGGLYSQTVKKRVFANIAKLPTPKDEQAAREVYAFLQTEGCDTPEALVTYRLTVEGLPALLASTEARYKEHLSATRAKASGENDTACTMMVATLKATAAAIPDKEQRKQWALGILKQSEGREKYFGQGMRVITDPSVAFLAKQAEQRLPDDRQLIQLLLDRLGAELKESVAGERDAKQCRLLSVKIEAAARHTKDPDQKRKWVECLSETIKGHETFTPTNARKGAKPLRDPCADTIQGLLASP